MHAPFTKIHHAYEPYDRHLTGRRRNVSKEARCFKKHSWALEEHFFLLLGNQRHPMRVRRTNKAAFGAETKKLLVDMLEPLPRGIAMIDRCQSFLWRCLSVISIITHVFFSYKQSADQLPALRTGKRYAVRGCRQLVPPSRPGRRGRTSPP